MIHRSPSRPASANSSATVSFKLTDRKKGAKTPNSRFAHKRIELCLYLGLGLIVCMWLTRLFGVDNIGSATDAHVIGSVNNTGEKVELEPATLTKTSPPKTESSEEHQYTSSFVTICQTNEPKRKKKIGEGQYHEFMIDATALRKDRENDIARAESFSKIYKDVTWGGGEVIDGKQFGGSGPGSLMSSTVEVRKTLDVTIDRVKKELGKDRIRMLDLPCGDLVWMKHYLNNRTDVDYTGMDIVGSLITEHSGKFSDTPLRTFQQHDIVKDPLPEKYDLIFSRQMTQHLGTEDTMHVLQHFSEAASYLLITNYLDVKRNTPLNTKTPYRFRPQNFNIVPFALTDPICEDEEKGCVNALYKLPLQQWN